MNVVLDDEDSEYLDDYDICEELFRSKSKLSNHKDHEHRS